MRRVARGRPEEVQRTSVPPIGQQFRSLNQQVYAALLQLIADRQIRPGERLRLDELAVQLRVSRTPIRDALSRLKAEGLVQSFGRSTLRVTQLGAEDLTHLYDLRLMCEVYALTKGFDRVGPGLIKHLEKCSRDLVRLCASPNLSDRLSQSLADREFHLLLIGLARNPRLTELYERLNIHIHSVRLGPSTLPPRERSVINAREHRRIIHALRLRKLDGATRALTAHIRNALARAIKSLRHDGPGIQAEEAPGIRIAVDSKGDGRERPLQAVQ